MQNKKRITVYGALTPWQYTLQRINLEDNKKKTAEFHTLSRADGRKNYLTQIKSAARTKAALRGASVAASPTWGHFTTVFTSGLIHRSVFPQETAARDLVLHPHVVATWNSTGGAVKHMDMWPQVHMAPYQDFTIYRLTTKIHGSTGDACHLDLPYL